MVGLVRHEASVQLQRQVLLVVGLVREVVWLVRRQPRARQDPGRARPCTRPDPRASPCWRWSVGLVIGRGTQGNTAPHREEKSTFTQGTALMEQHNASRVRPAVGCWYTLLLPVLSCVHWEGNFVRCVLTGDTRLARAELLGEVNIVEGTRRRCLAMRVGTRSTHTK